MKKRFEIRISDKAFDVIIYTLAIAFALICLYPLYLVLINSFSDPYAVARGEVFLLPKPYIKSGIPMFIDKPITYSEEDAKEFMAELKANKVPVFGGSMVVFSEGIKKLKESLKTVEYGSILGGFIRMPVNKCNPYGNFHFYSQHGIQCMMEVFGMNPRSVQVFEKGITYTCVVRYDDYDVVLFFAEDTSVYYQAIDYAKKFLGEEISLEGCADEEFMEFHELLTTRNQKNSYEEIFAPVYVINAIDRAIKSGKEETIVKYEV